MIERENSMIHAYLQTVFKSASAPLPLKGIKSLQEFKLEIGTCLS